MKILLLILALSLTSLKASEGIDVSVWQGSIDWNSVSS